MEIETFNDELFHFLYYQNHVYRFDNYDVDLELAEQILYQLTSAMMNNCVEFVFMKDGIISYKDCYKCSSNPCNMEYLGDVLKAFKKMWRGMR